MCLQDLVSDHYKVITPFFVMVIILLSLVTYSQSASSTVTYGNKSDTRMNYSPFRLPFGTGFASITTAAADTCQKLPTTNATKAKLIELTKPAAPTSIPVSTCTPNPTPGPVATKQIKARMAIAEMVSYKSFEVYYTATEETIEDMTNPYTPKTDPAG